MDRDNEIVALDDPAELSAFLLMPRILWAALAFSVVMYVVVGHVVAPTRPATPLDPVLVYALGGVAVAVAAAIPFLRRVFLPPRSDREGAVGPTRRVARALVARFQTALILSLALAEAVAVFGLVLTFLSGDRRYVIAFAAVSLVCFAMCFPRAELLRSILRAGAEGDARQA